MPENIAFAETVGTPKVLAQNHYFELLFYPKSGSLLVADHRGSHYKNWSVYTALQRKNEIIESQSRHWKVRRIKEKGNKKQLVLVTKGALSSNKIVIQFDWDSPQLEIKLLSRSRNKGKLQRQALVMGFEDSLSYVFRKTGILIPSISSMLIYLDQQGFLTGKNQRVAGIYPALKLHQCNIAHV